MFYMQAPEFQALRHSDVIYLKKWNKHIKYLETFLALQKIKTAKQLSEKTRVRDPWYLNDQSPPLIQQGLKQDLKSGCNWPQSFT